MRKAPVHSAPSEAGFVLIEVLVSALVLVIASAGVVALVVTTVHSQAEERNSSEAFALAQEDQARLASMRLEDLSGLNQTRTVALNKTEFKVHSTGIVINDITSAPSCGKSTYSADYVQVSSVVTWPKMASAEKAKIVSKLSPSNGSLDPSKGSLAVSVANQALTPMPGVGLFGGSGVINGSTDATGCAVFPDLPEGNYSLTVNGEAAGLINKDGKSSEVATVPVVGGDTKRVEFQFDRPGTIPVKFKYRIGSGVEFKEPATADSVVAFNTGMKEARIFGIPGGSRGTLVNATPLFPFTSTYTLYAGSCAANNPNPEGKNPAGEAAMANVAATAGTTAPAVTLQLPALELTVKNGTALKGARVTITDTSCKDSSGSFIKRVYTTNESGFPSISETGQPEFGLPWGTYNICASKTISGSPKRKELPGVPVQTLTAATVKSIDLSSGTSSGACP